MLLLDLHNPTKLEILNVDYAWKLSMNFRGFCGHKCVYNIPPSLLSINSSCGRVSWVM